MSVILVFLLGVAAFAAWWLTQQGVMSKPWLEQGTLGGVPDVERPALPIAKLGLAVFLVVVGALFALFVSAYFMRMEYSDWRPAPLPDIVWLNTGVLVVASIALHFSVVAARQGEADVVRLGLVASGLATILFLIGQLVAWRHLSADGYVVTGNPASSFFYLITGLHGLHILGGMVALGRAMWGAWNENEPERLTLRVEMCAMYWHFLLFVWLAVVVVLAGWAADFIAICSRLLS